MADQKISELNAKVTIHDDDMFVMVDTEAAPDETKKITGANLKSQLRSLGDDVFLTFGGVASLGWETADANANALILALPDGGGGTDVPIFVIGDQSILNADIGRFSGLTEPCLAVANAAADTYLLLTSGDKDSGIAGIYFIPPTDEDVTLLRVFVSGSPTIIWDESDDDFAFSHGLDIAGNIVISGTVDGVDVAAHKDRHDPNDGADPLDCAAASEIAGVQAAAEGSAHSFARSDHAHQIQHGITDNHLVTVDGSPNSGEVAVWTANGLDGKTYAEFHALQFASALPEDTGIILDSAISADGKYSPVYMFAGTAGTNLAFGQVVYFASADSKWELTDADAEATTKPRIAIVVVAGNEDASVTLMGEGYIREDDWNWTTPGAPLFIDATTAGDLTETAPAGSGDCVRIAGYVVDANTIFFKPDNTWVEVS